MLILSYSTITTGNVISHTGLGFYFSWFGFILILGSLLMFVTRKSLDSVIIPTGGDEAEDIERAKEGEKAYDERNADYIVVSGNIRDSEEDKNQSRRIVAELKRHGINPSKITIEGRARDSIQNIIYSFRKIKQRGGTRVGIVSYPDHLNRFTEIFHRAQSEGLIDPKFKLYRIPTKENQREKFYEVLAHVLHKYKLRNGVKRYLERPDPMTELLKGLALKAKKFLGGK